MSSTPINFVNSAGQWQAIDSTLVADSATGYGAKNAANSYQVEFPQTLGSTPVKVSVGKVWLGFSLEGASAPLTTSGATATYANALPGVSVSYKAEGGGTRENLSLTNASAPSSYSFAVTAATGVSLTALPTGGITVTAGSSQIGTIDPPRVHDANGATGPATMSLSSTPNGWTITVSVDPSWLTAASRVYPVVIDPDVTINASSMCELNDLAPTIYQGCGQFTAEQVNNAGVVQIENGVVQFSMSSIPFDSVVTQANLTLSGNEVGTTINMRVQSLGQAWDPNSVTWNNASSSTAWSTPGGTPATSPPQGVYSSEPVAASTSSWNYYPTQLVQAWISNQANNGAGATNDGFVVSEDATPSYGQGLAFNISSATVVVSYFPRLGLSSALKYDAHRLNDRSTLFVQVANQNGVVDAQDADVRGTGLALNVNRIYNTLTQSWSFSIGQDVAIQSSSNPVNPVEQTPTGMVQTFAAASAGSCNFKYSGSTYSWPVNYTATAGGDGDLCFDPVNHNAYALEKHSNGEVLLFGRGTNATTAGTLTGFSTRYLLTQDIDHNGNTITYSYATNNTLSGITDTQGRSYTATANLGHIASVSGPTGSAQSRTWTYTWNSTTGLLDSYTDAAGGITHYTYNASGVLDEIQTPGVSISGSVVASETDLGLSTNSVTSITQKDSSCAAVGPSTSGSCVIDYIQVRSSLSTTRCEASGSGSNPSTLAGCATVTDAKGNLTSYGFDEMDRAVKAVDGLGHGQQTSYNPDSQIATTTDAANSAVTTFNYNGGPTGTQDQVSSASEPTGAQSGFNYTSGGNSYQPTAANDSQGNCSSLTYDSSSSTSYGNITSVGAGMSSTSPTGACSGSAAATSQTTYQLASGGTAPTTSCGAPNHPGVACSTTGPDGNQTTYTYDANGNPTGVTPPGSSNTGTSATSGSTLKASSQTVDGLSRVATVTDANGNVTAYWYDKNDRLIEVNYSFSGTYNATSPPTCTSFAECTVFTYDPDGNLTSRQDLTGLYTYTYNHFDRVLTELPPATTSATFGKTNIGGTCDTYTNDWKRVNKYNLSVAGTLSQLSIYLKPGTASGSQLIEGVLYADNNGSPAALLATTSQLSYANTSSAGWYSLTFTSPPTVAAGNYWIGVITGNVARAAGYCFDSIANSRDYNSNTYTSGPTNPFGAVSQDDRSMSIYATYTTAAQPGCGSSTTDEMAYTYDNVGNTATACADARTTTYSYDAANELLSAADTTTSGSSCPTLGSGAPVKCVTFSYDADHHRTGREVPGGVTQTVTYDNSGRPTAVNTTGITSTASGVTPLSNYSYGYTKPGGGDTNLIWTSNGGTYTYDSLNRITSASIGGHTWNYTYDAAGNRLTSKEDSGATTYYAYNTGNELCWTFASTTPPSSTACASPPSGASTYTYDHNGNQLSGPVSGTALTISYNDRNFAIQTVGTSTYNYSYTGLDQTDRTAGDGITFDNSDQGLTRGGTTDYIRTPDGTLAWMYQPSSGNSYYYLYDGRDNIAGLVNNGQQTIDSYTYDPYGTTTATETVSNPFRYAAGYQDPTGLYHYGARYYDPTTGRFTQTDPTGQDAGYVYAGDNPINNADPTGRDFWSSAFNVVSDVVGAVQTGLETMAPVGFAVLGASAVLGFGLGIGEAFAIGFAVGAGISLAEDFIS